MQLKPVCKIKQQEWMVSEETDILFNALIAQAKRQGLRQDIVALFVGGCVRNAIMEEQGGNYDNYDYDYVDYDIATILSPDVVMEGLSQYSPSSSSTTTTSSSSSSSSSSYPITAVPTGVRYGTVTAVINGKKFEITTLRRDIENYGRHAKVEFTDSWLEDAKRRDFTMNSLLADRSGNIYDPLGQGLADIKNRVIRFVGNPQRRIEEDYLRILRFFRFHAFYGNGQFDEAALAACRKFADKVKTLSKERITQEYFKIIESDKARFILDVMFENGVMKDLKFAEYDPDLFQYFCEFQEKYKLMLRDDSFIASRLYVFSGLDTGNIDKMKEYILFPKVFLRDIKAISAALKLPDLLDEKTVKECIYRYGRVITAQTLMIELAQDRIMNISAAKGLKLVQNWDIPDFPLRGQDLIEAGISQGAEIGAKLGEIEDWWIKGGFKAGRQQCLSRIHQMEEAG